MYWKIAINSIGILLNIVGALMLYHFSPFNFHTVDGGDSSTDWLDVEERTDRKNKMVKLSVAIIIFGSILQLASNFLRQVPMDMR
ncbi:MAG: hypothetical protein DMF63_02055 [Acidobacteria bacterium]|nr:MAG: hypothetical protein DMF63_02055 [Acidobacteriota bacterium]